MQIFVLGVPENLSPLKIKHYGMTGLECHIIITIITFFELASEDFFFVTEHHII